MVVAVQQPVAEYTAISTMRKSAGSKLTLSTLSKIAIFNFVKLQFRQLSVVAHCAEEAQLVVEKRFRLLLRFAKLAAWSHLAPSWYCCTLKHGRGQI